MDRRVDMGLSTFEVLLDSRMEIARQLMRTVLGQMKTTAPEGAGDVIKLACTEYFARQEKLFLAELNKIFPDTVKKGAG